jgi:hypothetical protein
MMMEGVGEEKRGVPVMAGPTGVSVAGPAVPVTGGARMIGVGV